VTHAHPALALFFHQCSDSDQERRCGTGCWCGLL